MRGGSQPLLTAAWAASVIMLHHPFKMTAASADAPPCAEGETVVVRLRKLLGELLAVVVIC